MKNMSFTPANRTATSTNPVASVTTLPSASQRADKMTVATPGSPDGERHPAPVIDIRPISARSGAAGPKADAVQVPAVQATSMRFARIAQDLCTASRLRGFDVPVFRSPPRIDGVDRSIKRRADGGAIVSVRLKGRPWAAVVADMIDGVVATNHLVGPAADRCRSILWLAVDNELAPVA